MQKKVLNDLTQGPNLVNQKTKSFQSNYADLNIKEKV